MASILSSVTNAAHSAAASLLSAAQIQAGESILPTNAHIVAETNFRYSSLTWMIGGTIPTSVTVKEDAADKPFNFEGLTGKNIFVSLRSTESRNILTHWRNWAGRGSGRVHWNLYPSDPWIH